MARQIVNPKQIPKVSDMKSLPRFAGGSTLGRGRVSIVSLMLVLSGAFTLLSAGGDILTPPPGHPSSTGPGCGSGGCAAGGGGDDETIGTLPTFHGGPTFDWMRFGRVDRPLLYVQGSPEAVLTSAAYLVGNPSVLGQAMPNGELRLVFVGRVEVAFDRSAFHAAALKVGVAIPERLPILRTNAMWNGNAIGPWWTYVYELPIAQFEANGFLDQAPVLAGVTTPLGSTLVRARANSDFVTLTQRW